VDLRKHVVLLSGATGAVGGAFAKFVLANGGSLALAVRRRHQVAAVTAVFGATRVLPGLVAPQDGEAAAGFVKGAEDALGPITAFVCTAGRWNQEPVGKEPAGQLLELLEANLLTGSNLARAVVGRMRRRRRGTLTFVGSAAVGSSTAMPANYLASKAALHEYVRALALELAGSGVTASAILPGVIDTPENRKTMPSADTTRWVPIDAVVEALAARAFGPTGSGGPLYPLLG
jgi:NAD(P)-dependent dehydrogenase (short-subunit alcohol dehydrogenase family)